MKGRFLASKDLKQLKQLFEQYWGFTEKLDYFFFQTEKGRIYVVSRDLEKLELTDYKINTIGMYFAEFKKEQLRLSIEGSQIIGPKATKNVLELDEEEMRAWMRGEDLDKETGLKDFAIIKHGNDFLGTGKCVEGKVLNFVPKARRLMVADLP